MNKRHRIGSAGSSRPTSGSQDSNMLRDTVNHLQQELLLSKAENQRVSEQLSCMMLLVKRAWQGDQKAAVDVANIVGVAPPDFEEKSGSFSIITATPKSRALNNWALLTIGVLNREYKAMEEQIEARQQYYLHHRQAYLDEQLLYHRDLQTKVQAEMSREAQREKEDKQRQVQQSIATNHQNVFNMIERNRQNQQQQNPTHSLLKRSSSYSEGSTRRVKSASHAERGGSNTFLTQPKVTQPGPLGRPNSSYTKPAKKPLHRAASQQHTTSNLTWADLVIDPAQNKLPQGGAKENGDSSIYRMAIPEASTNGQRAPRQRRISYDDPVRYNTEGLFDAENALGPGSSAFRQRPVSAKAQRESDSVRARPKSAVYVQGERSMKYEVVRPTSAAVHNRAAKSTSATANRRPPSGKKTNKPERTTNTPVSGKYTPINGHLNSAQNGDLEDSQHGDFSDSDESQDTNRVAYDQQAFQKLGIDLRELEREEKIPPMKINIKKPQSVIDFERDVEDMHSMETEIRKATLALQKKLGISENGMI